MDFEDQIAELEKQLKYSPHFFLGTRVKHLQKQTAFFTAQTAKIKAYVQAQADLQLIEHRLEHAKQLEEQTFEIQMELGDLQIQQTRTRKRLELAASALGVGVETYNAHMLNKLNVDVDIDRARQLADVEVDKHAQMKQIDDEYEGLSVKRQLEAALAYQQITIEQSKYALRQLVEVIQELHQLEYSGKPIDLIEAQRPVYQMVIDGLKDKLRGLLQADNGEDASGSDTNPFGRKLVGPDLATGQE